MLVVVDKFTDPRRPDPRYYRKDQRFFWIETDWGRELHIVAPDLLEATVQHPHLTRKAFPVDENTNPSFIAPWGDDPDDRSGEPGLHDQHMAIISKWFKPGALWDMLVDFEAYADELLSGIKERGDGRFDLARDFANPFTLRCAGRLLGIELPEEQWRELIDEHVQMPFDNVSRQPGIDVAVHELITRRTNTRKHDEPARMIDDIIAAVEDGSLDRKFVPAIVWMVVVAMESTTAANIVSTMGLLDEHGLIEHVRDNISNQRVVTGAIEESLRLGQVFDGTPPLLATRDLQIGEIDVPAGTIVYAWYVSANMQLGGPKFDITRRSNHHVAFSTPGDPHRCTGSKLARALMEMALRTLVTLPGLRRDHSLPVQQVIGLNSAYMKAPFMYDTATS